MDIKFTINGGDINCTKSGQGDGLLIALHGFTQSGLDFDAIAKIWENKFVIYAPDLAFHGKTHWTKDNFTQEDIQELILAILKKENCISYHLLGHSLGGKLILATLADLIHLPESIILIAPDGLATRRMLLPNLIPNFLKRSILQSNKRALIITNIARFLHKLKWIDTFSIRYLNYNFKNKKRRERLLNTWLFSSNFRFNKSKLLIFLAKKQLPLFIFIGKKDRFITSKEILKFAQKAPFIQVFEYDGKHRMDDEKMLKEISQLTLPSDR